VLRRTSDAEIVVGLIGAELGLIVLFGFACVLLWRFIPWFPLQLERAPRAYRSVLFGVLTACPLDLRRARGQLERSA